jgi:nucleoside-diphosphate-sugar epimerase
VPTPLNEQSPLRATRYPYRSVNTPPGSTEYYYDKVLAEAAARARPDLPATILRLPKVYGPEENADLRTVYAFRGHPGWRWTHGHVANVARAIAVAVSDGRAAGQIYNIGEVSTPSMGDRLAGLPAKTDVPLCTERLNFEQDVNYDTSKIRRELGYTDVVNETTAMRAVVGGFFGEASEV